jgi:hypothetical protein
MGNFTQHPNIYTLTPTFDAYIYTLTPTFDAKCQIDPLYKTKLHSLFRLFTPLFMEKEKRVSASLEPFFAGKRLDFIFLSPRSTLESLLLPESL